MESKKSGVSSSSNNDEAVDKTLIGNSQNIVRLFLGGLPIDSSVEELESLFAPLCIKVIGIQLKYRKENVCAGFGYLKCQASADQASAILSNGSVFYKKRNLDIKLFAEKDSLQRTRNDI